MPTPSNMFVSTYHSATSELRSSRYGRRSFRSFRREIEEARVFTQFRSFTAPLHFTRHCLPHLLTNRPPLKGRHRIELTDGRRVAGGCPPGPELIRATHRHRARPSPIAQLAPTAQNRNATAYPLTHRQAAHQQHRRRLT